MKKRFSLMVLLFLFAFAGLDAQTLYFYYYKGEKQYLTLDKTKLNITTSRHFQKDGKKNTEFEILGLNSDLTTSNLMFGNIKLHSGLNEATYEEVVNLLKN